MTNSQYIINENKIYTERYSLASERIKLVNSETAPEASPCLPVEIAAYFNQTSAFLIKTCEVYGLASSGRLVQMDIAGLKSLNQSLYKDIEEDNYQNSYANPCFAAEKLGSGLGTLLCVQ